MNLKAGYPFWLVKDGLPHTFPKLDRDIETDVVVMGAGISGALVRYYLLEAGIDCVTVDARTIGLGSTCASTSLLQYEIDTPLHQLREMMPQADADRAFKLCDRAIFELGNIARKLDVPFELKPSLYFAAYKKDLPFLRREFEARKDAGFDVEWLDADAVQSRFHFSSPGAILSSDGAQTNAYLFAHALLQQHYTKHPIYDRTKILDIVHKKDGVTLTTESGFKLRAKRLVYATGYEVIEFLDKDIVQLLSTYAVVSEQYPKETFWPGNVLMWNTADPYLYLRTTEDHRILIGGRDETFANPERRDRLIGKKTEQLVRDFKKLFPNVDFDPEFSWTGTFGSTKDGLPYIGPYAKLPNSYFALGFGGNGITFSQIAAEIIRDLMLGKNNPDVALFRFDR